MRTAADIVEDYRNRGYSDERLLALAATRSEPMRSEIIALIQEGKADSAGDAGESQTDIFLAIEQKGEALIDDFPPENSSGREKKVVLAGLEGMDLSDAEILKNVEGDMNKEEQGIKIIIDEMIEISLDESDVMNEIPLQLQGLDSEGAQVADSVESESLIKAAYDRAGIEIEDTVEADGFDEYAYVAPELTLVNCEDIEYTKDAVISIDPEYALSEQEREEALERSQAFEFHQMAKTIEADFEQMRREAESEEIAIVCEDFDYIARPATDMATSQTVSSSSEVEAEIVRMRSWMNELEDGLAMKDIELSKAVEQLSERDDTIVTLGRELDQHKQAIEAIKAQAGHDSGEIARLGNVLEDRGECIGSLKAENAQLAARVEELQSQLQGASCALAGQSRNYSVLKSLVDSLTGNAENLLMGKLQAEDLLHKKEQQLEDAQQKVAKVDAEILSLRAKLAEQNEKIVSIARERDELADSGKDIAAIERDYNILKLETVPNLQRDKEELVAMVGEEHERCIDFEAIASRRSKRLSYTLTIAAAACFMLVLSPVLSWNSHKTDLLEQEAAFAAKLAQAQNIQDALSAERDNLKINLQAIKADFTKAQSDWNTQLASLRTSNVIAPRRDERSFDNSMFDMPAVSASASSESNSEQVHYNGVSGIDNWRNNQQVASSDEGKFKKATVRRGEGMSHVLWRIYRNSTPQMVSYISKINNLKLDSKGNPVLRIGQKLKLPSDIKTAMANF